MLKLERLKRDNKVSIAFTAGTRLWTKEFCQALTAAILIHAAALLLFSIDLGFPLQIYDKAKALVVFASYENPAIAYLDEGEEKTIKPYNFLQAGKKKAPLYQTCFWGLQEPSAAREIAHKPLHISSEERIPSPSGPCQPLVRISQGAKFAAPPKILSKTETPCKASLAFKSYQGQIFWLEWIEMTGDKELDRLLEEEIKKSRTLYPNFITLQGMIEIEFLP